jgi:alkylated DNA repair dioxygenase AlkB
MLLLRTKTLLAVLCHWQHRFMTTASGNPESLHTSNKRQRLLAPLVTAATSGSGAARSNAQSSRASSKQPRNIGKQPRTVYREPAPGSIDLGDGGAVYFSAQLCSQDAAALFQQLKAEVAWEQRSVRVMGRTVPQPRLINYQADSPHLQYTYSGTTLQPAPWHAAVAALRRRVEEALGGGSPPGGFNSCLLNYYRSGQDSIAWHSDNEPLYGKNPTIGAWRLACAPATGAHWTWSAACLLCNYIDA